MVRCKRCKGVAKMGKACKPKDNPTKAKVNNLYCPKCGWAENKKDRKVKTIKKSKKVTMGI